MTRLLYGWLHKMEVQTSSLANMKANWTLVWQKLNKYIFNFNLNYRWIQALANHIYWKVGKSSNNTQQMHQLQHYKEHFFTKVFTNHTLRNKEAMVKKLKWVWAVGFFILLQLSFSLVSRFLFHRSFLSTFEICFIGNMKET